MLLANILQRVFSIPVRLLLDFFFHFKVKGKENLKELGNRGAILAANHGSFIDPPAIGAALGPFSPFLPLRFLAKESFFKFPNFFFSGILFYVLGAFPVKRGLGDLRLTLKKGIEILKKGGTIVIFPEGKMTRIGDLKTGFGQLQKGRRGVVFLAQETGVPIVPIGLKGNFKALKLDIFFLRRRYLEVVFGKPIFISKKLTLEQGADLIMFEIQKLLKS